MGIGAFLISTQSLGPVTFGIAALSVPVLRGIKSTGSAYASAIGYRFRSSATNYADFKIDKLKTQFGKKLTTEQMDQLEAIRTRYKP